MFIGDDGTCAYHGCDQRGHSVCHEVYQQQAAIAATINTMLADVGNTILPTYSTQLKALLAENFPTSTTT